VAFTVVNARIEREEIALWTGAPFANLLESDSDEIVVSLRFDEQVESP
jgi:hypothetical protein